MLGKRDLVDYESSDSDSQSEEIKKGSKELKGQKNIKKTKKVRYNLLPMKKPRILNLNDNSNDSKLKNSVRDEFLKKGAVQKLSFKTVNGEEKQLVLPKERRGRIRAEDSYYHQILSEIHHDRMKKQLEENTQEEEILEKKNNKKIKEINQNDLLDFDERKYILTKLRNEDALKNSLKIDKNFASSELEKNMASKVEKILKEDLSNN